LPAGGGPALYRLQRKSPDTQQPKELEMREIPEIYSDHDGKPANCLVCKHLHWAKRGLRYYALSNKVVRRQAWCEACHEVLKEEKEWNARSEAFADFQAVCTGCFKEAVRRHTRIAWGKADEETLSGALNTQTALAIAFDLESRVLDRDASRFNFSDEVLHDLLPEFGDEVINQKLPKLLREAIIREMNRLAGC
jgi:hypothetical protein